MNLPRQLEAEVMDTHAEACDYDAMDHSAVNRLFIEDLLSLGHPEGDVLDLGTGTALIPIELCRKCDSCRVMAVDAAVHMLDLARINVEVAGFPDRIFLNLVDAKKLPYAAHSFSTVMSNSIVHHIPEPIEVLQEAVRVTAANGLIFFRDLLRPADANQLRMLVDQYAGDANEHQRQMFADSLHAALSLNEIRDLIQRLGFDRNSVVATSDRHWTWTARKNG